MRRVLGLFLVWLLLSGAGVAAALTPPDGSATRRASDPAVTKLLVFVVENHSLRQMRRGMPATFALAKKYGYATDYRAVTHPSLPNYIAMASGRTHGVDNDAPPSRWKLRGSTVFSRAIAAGKTARVYAESMTRRCQRTSAGRYAVKHNPWAYFVNDRADCDRFDRRLRAFHRDAKAGKLPNAGLVVPNLCNDAHDCSLATADDWFDAQMRRVFAGPDWASGHLAVVLTADEDDSKSGNRVLTVVIHPSQRGHVVTAALNHYALFELYEDVLGLGHRRRHPQSPSMARAFGLQLP
jgi:acid phosphatase